MSGVEGSVLGYEERLGDQDPVSVVRAIDTNSCIYDLLEMSENMTGDPTLWEGRRGYYDLRIQRRIMDLLLAA